MIKFQNFALAILSTLVLMTGTSFGQDNGQSCNQGNGTANRGGQQAMAGLAMMQGRGGGGAGQGLGPQETAQRMMSSFDEDGDGALDMQELTNGLAALQQSMMRMRGQQQGQGGQQMRRGGGGQGQAQNQMAQRGRNNGGGSGQSFARQGRGGPGGGGSRGGRGGR